MSLSQTSPYGLTTLRSFRDKYRYLIEPYFMTSFLPRTTEPCRKSKAESTKVREQTSQHLMIRALTMPPLFQFCRHCTQDQLTRNMGFQFKMLAFASYFAGVYKSNKLAFIATERNTSLVTQQYWIKLIDHKTWKEHQNDQFDSIHLPAGIQNCGDGLRLNKFVKWKCCVFQIVMLKTRNIIQKHI